MSASTASNGGTNMPAFNAQSRSEVAWPAEGVARVPYPAFFASAIYALDQEPLEDYIGPVMRPWLDRVFNRPVKVLGYARQWIGGNWKLYNENVRDPYHASLLHLFNATFRLARSSQIGGSLADDRGRHSLLHGYQREAEGETAAYTAEGIKTYQAKYALADPSLMETRQEYEIALTFSIHAI